MNQLRLIERDAEQKLLKDDMKKIEDKKSRAKSAARLRSAPGIDSILSLNNSVSIFDGN